MVVSYQLHAPTALLLGVVPTVTIKCEAWWAQEMVWIFLGREKFLLTPETE